MWAKKQLKIHNAVVLDTARTVTFTLRANGASREATPGTVAVEDKRLFVTTGEGILEITTLQLEGKPAMDANSFLNGHPEIQGTKLG